MKMPPPPYLTALAIGIAFTANTAWADAIQSKRLDLRHFSDHAETCLHLSGELTGDNTLSQKELIQQINQQCSTAKREFKKLDKKYKNDRQAQSILEPYRDALE